MLIDVYWAYISVLIITSILLFLSSFVNAITFFFKPQDSSDLTMIELVFSWLSLILVWVYITHYLEQRTAAIENFLFQTFRERDSLEGNVRIRRAISRDRGTIDVEGVVIGIGTVLEIMEDDNYVTPISWNDVAHISIKTIR